MKRLLLKTVVITMSLISSANAATWLAQDASVEEVWSTNSDRDSFYVKLSGQTGPCAQLEFRIENMQSPQAYSHAFSLAVTAFIHNKKVDALSYVSDKCGEANFISIHN